MSNDSDRALNAEAESLNAMAARLESDEDLPVEILAKVAEDLLATSERITKAMSDALPGGRS